MIGTEAFPDLLSEFSTKYMASNKNRTTNIKKHLSMFQVELKMDLAEEFAK